MHRAAHTTPPLALVGLSMEEGGPPVSFGLLLSGPFPTSSQEVPELVARRYVFLCVFARPCKRGFRG